MKHKFSRIRSSLIAHRSSLIAALPSSPRKPQTLAPYRGKFSFLRGFCTHLPSFRSFPSFLWHSPVGGVFSKRIFSSINSRFIFFLTLIPFLLSSCDLPPCILDSELDPELDQGPVTTPAPPVAPSTPTPPVGPRTPAPPAVIPPAELQSFEFLNSQNPTGVNIPGTIDDANQQIIVEVPAAQLTAFKGLQNNLTTTFGSEPGVNVKIGNTVQESGKTANDFLDPITYNVSTPDEEKTYDVVLKSGDVLYIPNDKLRVALEQDAPNSLDQGWLNTVDPDLQNIVSFDINNFGIVNTSSIQYLTGLGALFIQDNAVNHIDLSKNTSLLALDISNNKLTSIDLSANTTLDDLTLSGNKLTKADIRGMQTLTLPDPADPSAPYTVLSIEACAPDGTNPLTELLVHENFKDHPEIKEAKTNCGSGLTIDTYSYDSSNTPPYTLVDSDYTPQ